MPDSPWLALLLGPAGLVVGCIYALWAFQTERIVSGATHKRVLDQNEALLRSLSRAVSVSGRLADKTDVTDGK